MHRLRCCGPASEKRLVQALGEMGLRLGRGRPAPAQPPPKRKTPGEAPIWASCYPSITVSSRPRSRTRR